MKKSDIPAEQRYGHLITTETIEMVGVRVAPPEGFEIVGWNELFVGDQIYSFGSGDSHNKWLHWGSGSEKWGRSPSEHYQKCPSTGVIAFARPIPKKEPVEIPFMERYGYHIITDGNYSKFSPRQSGDEVEVAGRFIKGAEQGFVVGHTYRRKVEVPAGYRLLDVIEYFQEGDKVLYETTSAPVDVPSLFHNISPPYAKIKGMVAAFRPIEMTTGREGNYVYCAPKPTTPAIPTADGWYKLSCAVPHTSEYPVWVSDGKEVDEAHARYSAREKCVSLQPISQKHNYDWDKTITHWKPMPKPVVPAPPKSDEQKAFEVAIEAARDLQDEQGSIRGYQKPTTIARARLIWDAAVAFTKGQK